MKDVKALIEKRTQEFAQLPLFKFMQDRNIDPKQRLSFAPCMAHFIMSFSDFNKYLFRVNNPDDKIQEIVNQYTYEDDNHWIWYITDIEKLGFNPKFDLSQALRFLWSEETKITRQISYQVAGYTSQADAIVKLAAIQALESMADLFFNHSLQVVTELQAITNKEYVYFGNVHLQVENGHTMDTPEIEEFITEIELTDSQRQEAFNVVEKIFKIFSEWTYELLAYAQAHKVEPALCK